MPSRILDPTGRTAVVTKPMTMAPRRADLQGCTIGLMENTKQNAALFLDELGKLLVEEHGAQGVVTRTKRTFAAPVPEAMLKELVADCDAVITGVGDCGSCSASAVADGIAFENAGLPAAVICSDAFRVTADAMAGVQGAPDYHYLTTPHPVAVLDADGVRERARRVLPAVVELLTSRQEAS